MTCVMKLYFNSIKVRLEQGVGESLDHVGHFNSIKVRLERLHQFLVLVHVHLFQFHKGTIRTLSDLSPLALQIENFNSIKVRLEQKLEKLEIICKFYFNSIKVRLERMIGRGTLSEEEISIP